MSLSVSLSNTGIRANHIQLDFFFFVTLLKFPLNNFVNHIITNHTRLQNPLKFIPYCCLGVPLAI